MNTALVVITRPEHKQAQAVKLYASAGFETLSLPLLKTRVRQDQELGDLLSQAQQADVIIFPSSVGVDACYELSPSFHPDASARVITVGPATADRWRHFQPHHAPQIPSQYNSEGVIELLKSYADVRQVYVLTAPGGRGLITEYCSEQGIRCDEVYVYERIPLLPVQTAMQQLKDNQAEVILTCTSVGTLRQFEISVPFLSKAITPIVCASARIANAALESGYAHVVTADSASDQDMLHAVQQFIKNH